MSALCPECGRGWREPHKLDCPGTVDLAEPTEIWSLGDETERAMSLSLYCWGHLDPRPFPPAERRWLEVMAERRKAMGRVA